MVCDDNRVGDNSAWVTILFFVDASYYGWIALVSSKFGGLEVKPRELIFIKRTRHATLRELEGVKGLSLWLAILPTIVNVAFTPKMIIMAYDLDWARFSISALGVWLGYLVLLAGTIWGWRRWYAICRRIAVLRG